MKATNNFIWMIRDATESEKSGLLLPPKGKVKPHTGEIVSAGQLTKDGNIRATAQKHGKAMFHPQVGFEIEFEGKTYLICQDHEIIGVL